MKMRYATSWKTAASPAGAASAPAIWFANGLYDVLDTGVGHQPMGFDQYMQFYQHATVLKAKFTLHYVADLEAYTGGPTSGTNSDAGCVLLSLRDTTGAITDYQRLREMGDCRWSTFTAMMTRPQTLSITYDFYKFFGGGVQPADSQHVNTQTTNPTEDVCFHVQTAPMNVEAPTAVSVCPPLRMQILIEYTVMLMERKPLTKS